MIVIDMRPHMTITDTSHLISTIEKHPPRIFDNTTQDMVMMQEGKSLDMKRPRLPKLTTPTIWCPPSLAPPPQWHLQEAQAPRRRPPNHMIINIKITNCAIKWPNS
jgi:hypothetical protein